MEHIIFNKSRTLHNIYQFLIRCLLIPITLISYFFPKSSNIWIFGSWEGKKYSDNSKYIFEHILCNEKQIKAFWMTNDQRCFDDLNNMKLPVLKKFSLKGIYISMRASLVICSNGLTDVNEFCSIGAKKVMLWHGIPVKKIEKDSLNYDTGNLKGLIAKVLKFFFKNKKVFPYIEPNWDMVLSTSELIQDRMSSAFNIDKQKVPILGYPRNDILFKQNYQKIKGFNKINSYDKSYFLYAPTFRSSLKDNNDLFKDFPVKDFNNILKKNNCYFFIKLHPILNTSSEALNKILGSNILLLENETYPDLNLILPNFDLILCDYSGAYIDYLLLNRPIVFTPFDLDNYHNFERGLYEDYKKNVPGPICMNWDEVLSQLQSFLNNVDNYRDVRELSKNKYHKFDDSNSCIRLANYLLNMSQKDEYNTG